MWAFIVIGVAGFLALALLVAALVYVFVVRKRRNNSSRSVRPYTRPMDMEMDSPLIADALYSQVHTHAQTVSFDAFCVTFFFPAAAADVGAVSEPRVRGRRLRAHARVRALQAAAQVSLANAAPPP